MFLLKRSDHFNTTQVFSFNNSSSLHKIDAKTLRLLHEVCIPVIHQLCTDLLQSCDIYCSYPLVLSALKRAHDELLLTLIKAWFSHVGFFFFRPLILFDFDDVGVSN